MKFEYCNNIPTILGYSHFAVNSTKIILLETSVFPACYFTLSDASNTIKETSCGEYLISKKCFMTENTQKVQSRKLPT